MNPVALYPVILCGGSGVRLWPASRTWRPKQFIALLGEHSLFQQTALRIAGLGGTQNLIVVAGESHADLVQTQLADLGVSAVVLLEPEARDSAPAMAAACAWIASRDPNGIAVLMASDHHIPDANAFCAAAASAARSAAKGLIITMGVAPSAPATAYGYIAPGKILGSVRRVDAFVEKPDASTAQTYVKSGYLWNSGNFIVAATALLSELDRHAPEISRLARQAVAEAQERAGAHHLSDAFRSAPKISIDYAVMEKTDRAAVLPVNFAWSDLGAWDAVWDASPKDVSGNAIGGECLLFDTNNCLVSALDGALITTIGVRNLAVVADGRQVLVCDMEKSQIVKAAVDHLKAQGRETQALASPFADLDGAAQWFDRWLRTSALPLWWSLGADHRRGGFHEALTPDGQPLDLPRRARVQARQVYVYARAGSMGWSGPWREAAWHGFDYLISKYRRPDGLFRARVSFDGAPLDDTALVYDQAFALLAMAALHQVDGGRMDLLGEARALLTALQSRRHSAGGFREAPPDAFQSNAHMHLLEAALAWIEADGGPEWEALAAEIIDLALRFFIDPAQGFLREFFDEAWAPSPSPDGRRLQPGHQFEWAWLFERWRRRGHASASAVAQRLYASGLRGIDARRGVAVDALSDDFSVSQPTARLWPQTEFLKASLLVGAEDAKEHALGAARVLASYLCTPAVGAWRDRLDSNGVFIEEPAPASTFYHIAGAVLELKVRPNFV